MARKFPRILLCMATVALFSTGVMAGEESPMVKAMLDGMAKQSKGQRPVYESLDVSGTTSTMRGLTLKMDSGKGAKINIVFGEMVFANEHTSPAGTLLADTAVYKNVVITTKGANSGEPEFTLSIPLITMTGAFVAPLKDGATAADKVFANNLRATNTSIPVINVSFDVKGLSKKFSAENITATWDGGPDSYSGTTNFNIERIHFSEEMLTGPDGRNPLSIVGYKQMTFKLVSTASQTVNKVNMNFAFNMQLMDANKGAIILSMAANDVPLAVLEAAQSGDQAKLKGALIQLLSAKIVSLKLRFEDASLTKRVMPVAAKAMGMPVEALAPNAAAMVQIGLAKLQSPEFTKQVVAAISAYLANPKTITASAKPAQPMAGAQLFGMAASPKQLIEALGVTVTAND